jgi:hypothetical protein
VKSPALARSTCARSSAVSGLAAIVASACQRASTACGRPGRGHRRRGRARRAARSRTGARRRERARPALRGLPGRIARSPHWSPSSSADFPVWSARRGGRVGVSLRPCPRRLATPPHWLVGTATAGREPPPKNPALRRHTFAAVGELTNEVDRRLRLGSRACVPSWPTAQLTYDKRATTRWGELQSYAQLRGRPRPANDSWTIACCPVREVPLAAFSAKDFTDTVKPEGFELVCDRPPTMESLIERNQGTPRNPRDTMVRQKALVDTLTTSRIIRSTGLRRRERSSDLPGALGLNC